MDKQSAIWTKLGFSAVVALVAGLWSWRQYLKYQDGAGLAPWLLPVDAHPALLVVVFIVVPALVSVWVGWGLGGAKGRRA